MIDRLRAALADRYRIEDELGAGGMATVYRAEDLKHKRRVAVKVLRPELAAAVGAERFLAEIETTAALQHPHILPLFDSGEAAGTVFYVMPFVEGESLRERLEREKELPVDQAVRIAREVADALGYAHRKGVIHRDVKPENILLHDGRALVADFGIALAVNSAGGERLTETGLSIGTPSYMSPEQAAGDRAVDGRTDVYALGCITYEMLAGQPPYTVSSAQAVLARVLTADPEPLSGHRPRVPPQVEHAVHAALSRIPADRPGTPEAFAELLMAPAPAARGAFRGPASRGRWMAALVTGVLLGALAGWVAAGGFRDPGAAAGPGVDQREQLTFNGRSGAPAISPDGDWVAYVEERCEVLDLLRCRRDLRVQEVGSTESLLLIEDAWELGVPRWVHDGASVVVPGRLGEQRAGVFSVPRLGGAVRYVGPPGLVDTHPAGDTVVVVTRAEAVGEQEITSVHLSTRTVRSAVRAGREGAEEETALVIALTDGTVVDRLALPSSTVYAVAWSPDGRRLALTELGGDLILLDREGDVLSRRPTASGRGPVRWTPDGSALVYFEFGSVKSDRLVRLDVTEDGRFAASPTPLISRLPTLYLGELDVARRSGRLAVITGDAIDDLWTIDLTADPVEASQVTRGTTWYGAPGISSDGSTLYYLRGDALGDNVYSLELESGEEEALTAQPLPGGSEVRTSPDGRWLAFNLSGPEHQHLELVEFPSGRRTTRVMDAGQVRYANPLDGGALVGWSPDRRRLVFLDSLGGLPRTPDLPPLPQPAYSPSPDGGRVAFAAPDTTGVVTLWVASLPAGGDAVGRPLDGDLDVPGITWATDGLVYLTRWLEEDDMPSLWRADPDGGAPRRVADLPVLCDFLHIVLSRDASRAVCKTSDYRSDVWWIDRSGL